MINVCNRISPPPSCSGLLTKTSLIVNCAIFLILTTAMPLSAQTTLCEDVRYLIEQSKTEFQDIQNSSIKENGGFRATKKLPDAKYCAILEDVEKRSFRCSWEYPHADGQAEAKYKKLAIDIKRCLGGGVSVIKDQPVNHPDMYKSYLYRVSDTDIRVALKDKRALMSSFVSLVIDGRPVTSD